MANVLTTSCTTFIQIWVDTNALQNGSTQGVYLVDNRVNNGSSNEGTPSLSTGVTTGTNICWEIFNVDLNSTTQLQIQSISNASVFGASGQPQVAPNNANAFTGTAQSAGNATYQITFNAFAPGGSGITTTVSPTLVVQ
jgi:hypothetical protein